MNIRRFPTSSFAAGRMSGFSLIELMIALVLGVVIVGGCISIFTGVVRSSNLNQTISNLQSNARFALDMIGRDIRAAGFLGCSTERDIKLNVTVANPPTINFERTAVSGYVVGSTSWLPGTPTSYTAPTGVGAPVPGTHALSIQYAQYPGMTLDSSMTTSSSDLLVVETSAAEFRADNLAVVSDCSSADLLKVNSVSSLGGVITLGNRESLTKAYTVDPVYPDSTRVLPFVSTLYYIGDTQRTSESGDDVYSLFAHSYPYTTANPPLELVEGVDQMSLEFGVRLLDGTARYVRASNGAYRDAGVETVRVGLLLTSLERFPEVDNTRSFTLAGQNVTAKKPASSTSSTGSSPTPPAPTTPAATPGSQTYTGDKRFRMPFNATFNVRNRNL